MIQIQGLFLDSIFDVLKFVELQMFQYNTNIHLDNAQVMTL